MYNPHFNSPEFEGIKNAAGLNRFILSVKQQTKKANSKGIIAKAGRYDKTTERIEKQVLFYKNCFFSLQNSKKTSTFATDKYSIHPFNE